MPTRTLASALKDFGARPPVAVEPFVVEHGPATALAIEIEPPAMDLLPDTDELIARAVAEAEAALTQRLEEEHAQALQAERDRHDEEVTELQQQFAAEAGDRILAGLKEMEERVAELTTSVAAHILGSVLTDSMRDRSLDRLTKIIADALADNEAVRIRITGSLPLYEALKVRLPGHAEHLDFNESPHFDLSVTIDDSVFETRLAEWSSALAEALS